MSSLGTADAGIVFVFARVAGHLAEGAACTPERAAEVLTSNAPLLGDGVLSPDRLASFAETVNRIEAEEETTQGLQNRNGNRNLIWIHTQRRHFESEGEDGISYKKQDDHLEGFLRRDSLAGLSKPREGHSGHDLGLHDLVTTH